MNGPDPWPQNGEVDIMESVNDNDQNQMTLHTGEGEYPPLEVDGSSEEKTPQNTKSNIGCYLTNPGVFSGTALVSSLPDYDCDCDHEITS
jgi:hypothetical protein